MENQIGVNLKKLRKSNNHTLESLGKELNISKSTLSDYENGKTSPPFDVCEKIADFFGININQLRNSDVTENTSLANLLLAGRVNKNFSNNSEKNTLVAQKNQIEYQNKLLAQQVEGLQVQLKLVNQILESKQSEIKSLQMQIKLLDEKLLDFKTVPQTH